MTTTNKVSNLFGFLPRTLRPQGTDLTGGVLWAGAGLTSALFLVQPFQWIKDQWNPPPAEEKK